MSTATKSKPRAAKRAKRAASPRTSPRRARNAAAGAAAVDEINGRLQAARDKLEKLEVLDIPRREKLAAEIVALEAELDLAQVERMPMINGAANNLPPSESTEIGITNIELGANHRERSSEAETARLARSLNILGLLEPVGLREPTSGPGKYLLIWGSRRLAAAKLAGWKNIAAVVYPSTLTDDQLETLRSAENLHHEDLTPVGKCLAIARMIDAVNDRLKISTDFDFAELVGASGGPEAYVAQLIGHEPDYVRDRAFVARLGGATRDLLSARRLTLGHARELAKLGNPKIADELAGEAAANIDGTGGGRSVEWIRDRVAEETRSLARVPFRLDVAFAKDRAAGCEGWACASCPFNSANAAPYLFAPPVSTNGDGPAAMTEAGGDPGTDADLPADVAGVCTNKPCFTVKEEAAAAIMEKGIEKIRREIKRNGEIELTKTALAPYVPGEIKPEAFVRECKRAIDPATGKDPRKSTGGASDDDGTTAKPASAAAKAERAHNQKLVAWKQAAASKITKAIAAKPARVLYFAALRSANALASMYERSSDPKWNEKAEAVAAKNPTAAIVKRWRDPKLSDLVALAKQGEKPDTHKYEIERLVAGAIAKIADSLGVELPDAPEPAEEA